MADANQQSNEAGNQSVESELTKRADELKGIISQMDQKFDQIHVFKVQAGLSEAERTDKRTDAQLRDAITQVEGELDSLVSAYEAKDAELQKYARLNKSLRSPIIEDIDDPDVIKTRRDKVKEITAEVKQELSEVSIDDISDLLPKIKDAVARKAIQALLADREQQQHDTTEQLREQATRESALNERVDNLATTVGELTTRLDALQQNVPPNLRQTQEVRVTPPNGTEPLTTSEATGANATDTVVTPLPRVAHDQLVPPVAAANLAGAADLAPLRTNSAEAFAVTKNNINYLRAHLSKNPVIRIAQRYYANHALTSQFAAEQVRLYVNESIKKENKHDEKVEKKIRAILVEKNLPDIDSILVMRGDAGVLRDNLLGYIQFLNGLNNTDLHIKTEPDQTYNEKSSSLAVKLATALKASDRDVIAYFEDKINDIQDAYDTLINPPTPPVLRTLQGPARESSLKRFQSYDPISGPRINPIAEPAATDTQATVTGETIRLPAAPAEGGTTPQPEPTAVAEAAETEAQKKQKELLAKLNPTEAEKEAAKKPVSLKPARIRGTIDVALNSSDPEEKTEANIALRDRSDEYFKKIYQILTSENPSLEELIAAEVYINYITA
jgi:hypothetical protein